MLTPDEIDVRRRFLESLSTEGQPLHANAAHASVNNPAWFQLDDDGELDATPERDELHMRILGQWEESNPHVVRGHSAIVMAGPPGAGKSTTRAKLFHGRDQSQWRHVDADDFKRHLLEEALADGTLQQLLPEEMRVWPGESSRFHPFELSALVHHESTNFLFNPALEDAIARGDNLIIDGTLAWKPRADRIVADLSEAGYRIRVVDVEAPKAVTLARTVERWRLGYLQALNKPTGPDAHLGGRWLPPGAVDALFTEFREPDKKPLHGKSVTEVNALEISEANTAVTQYDLYRTLSAKGAAEHVERRKRSGRGELVVTSSAGSADLGAVLSMPSLGHPHSLRKMLGKMPQRGAGAGRTSQSPETGPGRDTGPDLSR